VKKLSGWQRIGIVASVLWAIGGFMWGLSLDPFTFRSKMTSEDWPVWYDICQGHAPLRSSYQECYEDFKKEIARENSNISFQWASAIAVAPVPFGWIIFGSLLGAGRWVRRGFAYINHAHATINGNREFWRELTIIEDAKGRSPPLNSFRCNDLNKCWLNRKLCHNMSDEEWHKEFPDAD